MTIIIILVLGFMMGSVFMRANTLLSETDTRIFSQQAFYAAEAGIEYAVYQLRLDKDFDPSAMPNGLQNVPLLSDVNDSGSVIGTYSIQLDRNGEKVNDFDTVWVRSTGTSTGRGLIENKSGQAISRSIVTRVMLIDPTEFFISTLGNINFVGGASFDHSILAKNIKFETNPSTPISIDGDVLYMQSITGYDHANPDATPQISIPSEKKVEQSPSITFTGLDLNFYRQLAQEGGGYYASTLELSGELTAEQFNSTNGVIFAEGNITIEGEYKDDLVIVSARDILFSGSLQEANDEENPQIGLLAKDNVIINGNAPPNLTIDAFILADGGRFFANGNQYSKGNLDFYGAISVRGTSGSESGVNLSVYSTRDYEYNDQLSTNRRIPFLPRIANIIEWYEGNPNDNFPPSCGNGRCEGGENFSGCPADCNAQTQPNFR